MTEPLARIEASLTHLGEEHEPPLGWEARVLAATARPKRRPWWWFALPVVALAAIVIVVPRTESQDLQLVVDLEKGKTLVRGNSAHIGDVVHAKVTGGKHERAIWVYRNDQLVMACPGAPQCQSSGDVVTADVTLAAMGTYKIVALTSNSPLPAPAGTLDADLARVSGDDVRKTEQRVPVY